MTDRYAIEIHKVRGIDSRRVVGDNETFRLNHYPIQSLQFFKEVKMTRGAADDKDYENVRTLEYFEVYDQSAKKEDALLAEMIRRQKGVY